MIKRLIVYTQFKFVTVLDDWKTVAADVEGESEGTLVGVREDTSG